MEKATERFGDGDFSYRITDVSGKNEIAKLAQSFNSMAKDIQGQQQKIIENERKEVEITKSREIAETVNPKELIPVPGLDLTALIRSATTIGGDIYDVFPVPQTGEYIIYIGDVSGHGVSAGMVGALTNAVLYSVANTESDHSFVDIVKQANALLTKKTPKDTHATLMFARWNPETNTLHYVNCGHNSFFIYRNDGSMERSHIGANMLAKMPVPLFNKNKRLVEHTITLDPGEVILFYTDGFTEAHNPKEELYGEERFEASFVRHSKKARNANDIKRGLLQDVDEFRQDYEQKDDISLVVLRAVDDNDELQNNGEII